MTDNPGIRVGASLGAWTPANVLDKLRDMAAVAQATAIFPYPWNLPVAGSVLRDIRNASHDLDLRLVVHGPIWEVYTASVYPQIRTAGVEAIERAIDFAVAIGAVHMTQHPGESAWPDVWPHMERAALDAQLQSYKDIAVYAQAAGIAVGIENMPASSRVFNGFVDCSEIMHVLEECPTLGVTLDIGHINTAGLDGPALIARLGGRINHVHAHDNRGQSDEHLPIGAGTVRWREIGRALRLASYSGIVEVERSLPDGQIPESIAALKGVLGLD